MNVAAFFLAVGVLGLVAWRVLPDEQSEHFVDAQWSEVGKLGGLAAVVCLPLGVVWLLVSL